jgi:starch synthase
MAGKARCKAELQRELGLPVRPRVPLFATISRLTDQKGIDLLCAVLESDLLSSCDMQYVVLGRGDASLESRLRALGERYPTRLAVKVSFDEALSHRTEAGSDFFVMPSRFEPCGLNQIYSMRYGTVPIVRAVGGLADTVVDYDARSRSGTGFTFSAYEPAALVHALRRALRSYSGDEGGYTALIRRAMRVDFGWAQSARAYLHIYKQALRDAHS